MLAPCGTILTSSSRQAFAPKLDYMVNQIGAFFRSQG